MISTVLLKEQLKRFWAVPVLGVLGYVFIILLPLHSAVSNEQHSRVGRLLSDLIGISNLPLLFMLLAMPLVAVLCVKSYFIGKNPATFFYALPLTKNQLFFTNALAGILLCLVPLVIFALGLLIPVEFYNENWAWGGATNHEWVQSMFPPLLFPGGVVHGSVINTPAAVGIFFLRTLTIMLFYFGLFWLAFSLSGHGVVAVLLSGALPLFVIAFPAFIGVVAEEYVFGYVFLGDRVYIERFVLPTTPILWGWHPTPLLTNESTRWLLLSFINYILLGAALFAGAYFISHSRKVERTGNSVVFTPIKNVLVFILSLGVMVAMGYIFWSLFLGVWLYVGFVIGFVVGYIIAQMIAEKSFSVVMKLRQLPIYGAFAFGIYLAMLLVTQFGMNRYVNHLPSGNEIVGINVGWNNMRWNDPELHGFTFVEDAAVIEETLRVHQNILDNRRSIHYLPVSRTEGLLYERYGEAMGWGDRWFNYLLADGSIMVRRYSIPFDYMETTGFNALMAGEPIILLNNVILTRPEIILDIDISHITWESVMMDDGRMAQTETISRIGLNITEREVIDKVVAFAIEALVARGAVDRTGWGGFHYMVTETEVDDVFISKRTELFFRADLNHPQSQRFRTSWISLLPEEWMRLSELLVEWGLLES